jgi:hypothetical protein
MLSIRVTLAARERDVAVRGIGGDAREARDLRTGVVRVVARLVHVCQVDIAIGLEVRIDREAEHSAVVVGIDLAAEVDERRRQERAVLEHAHQPVLLPDEHRAGARPLHADDLVLRQRDDRLRGEAGIGERLGAGRAGREQRECDQRSTERAHALREQAGTSASPDLGSTRQCHAAGRE